MPSELTLSGFWLRFFFRTYQIRKEEEKRKALIQSLCFLIQPKSSCFFLKKLMNIPGTADTSNDDDFSWEDDEEELSSASDGKPVMVKNKPSIASV